MKNQLDGAQLRRSLLCAEFCVQSYSLVAKHDEVRTLCVSLLGAKSECFTAFLSEYRDTQAMVLNNDDEIYLTFPGTDSETDILTDVMFELVSYGGGHVHSAFLDVARKTYPKVIDAVKTRLMANPNAKIIVTGHSLGGALAMLYTEMLLKDNIAVTQLITFGQPRVGNWRFAEAFKKFKVPYIRFVNESDIVPDVPPPWDKNDWTHAGSRLTFEKGGGLRGEKLGDETQALRRTLDLILRFIVMWLQNERKFDVKLKKALMDTVDHPMAMYMRNIKAYIADNLIESSAS